LKGGSIGDVMDMSATSSGAGVANSISRKGSTQKVAVELSSTKVADGVVFNANESGKTSRTRRVYG
jgi:hypothetical protein